MASKVIVLALVFFAIVGLASAAAAPAPSTTVVQAAEAPLSDDFIGTDDAAAPSGGDAVVPGPMGSVEAAGGPSGSPKSDSAALKFSAITGVAAVAGCLFF
ncbi:anther-specific protein BCP1-like [Populus alba x Populus x berolinensis]|uniref:Anther-specific protein BCP1-like n=1 Tax=Populus alba x Populus x berolinensis TaxID=444605 RepID=A0AAD6MNK9_9ROSI|nr:anther-specific protein BCP1-like [Populus alba x Populus x berolinensis]